MKEEKTVCDGDKILAGKNKTERHGRLAKLRVPIVSPLSFDVSRQSLESYKISKAYFSTWTE